MNRNRLSLVALDDLKSAAQDRCKSELSDKVRVIVQEGHCSQSVGVGKVTSALSEALPKSVVLSVAGCDGACFEAIKIVVTSPSGSITCFTDVTLEDIKEIVTKVTSGLEKAAVSEGEFFCGQQRIVLDACGLIDPISVDEYVLRGGYAGLSRTLEMTPEDVIEVVKVSGLRGRGGAYFPTHSKWEAVRSVGSLRYLVVNAEEGEPGVFKDRHIMEGVPHRIIEGTVIAAYASGANKAYIYVNAEAELSAQRLEDSVTQAYEHNILGHNILRSGFSLDVQIVRGAGGYVCGEETTLLNTMEGYRREPRLRPPYPTTSGLHARPTVINNVETLANLGFIMDGGDSEFLGVGCYECSGTKVVSLSGSVQRPGIVEIPMGTSLRRVIYDIGGGPQRGCTLTAVAIGGPSSGMLPPSMLDVSILPGMIHESGVILGAGGIVVLDHRLGILEAIRNLAAYNAAESCGKCTPCREGTPLMVDYLDRLVDRKGSQRDLDHLQYLADVVGLASLCGLGQAAGGPINSALSLFGDQLFLSEESDTIVR